MVLTCSSLVFSSWKRTTDAVACLCSASNINFRLIDGTTRQSDRARHVEQFKTDRLVSVLIMTLGTGALGSVAADGILERLFVLIALYTGSTSLPQLASMFWNPSGTQPWKSRRSVEPSVLANVTRRLSFDTSFATASKR